MVKLDKLNMLTDELHDESLLKTFQSSVYYFYNEKWNALKETSAIADDTISALNIAIKESLHQDVSSIARPPR